MHLATQRREAAHDAVAPLVAVIDDDRPAQLSTRCLLESEGYRVLSFANGDEFLESGLRERPFCVLLDIQMSGRNGFETLGRLAGRKSFPPILVVTAKAHLDVAVAAMKLGAADFIQKPYAPTELLRALEGIAALEGRPRSERAIDPDMARMVEGLTERQRQVLAGIVRGRANKNIAWELQISVRTVESYRAQLFRRLGVRSTAEAVRIALAAGFDAL